MADRMSIADKICSEIKHICKTFGSREAGGKGESAASDHLAEGLKEAGADVGVERFKLYPSAHMSWTYFMSISAAAALIAYFFSSFLSLLLLLIGIVPYILEYLLISDVLDPLFKPADSQNVIASAKPAGEVEKRIYLVAHIDAGKEWTLLYRLGSAVFLSVRALNIIGVLYLAVLSVVRWVYFGAAGTGIVDGALMYAGLAGLFFVIPWTLTLFFISKKTVTDGANEDLTGCLIAAHALGAAARSPYQNTEVGVLITGGSSVGLRGAQDFAKRHKGEFDPDNTCFISLNCIRERDHINVNSSESVLKRQNSPEVVALIKGAAEDCGIKCSAKSMPFAASSDSFKLRAAGYRSASITAIQRHLPDYYRTRYDSYDNVSAECIGEVYALILKVIDNFAGEDNLYASAPERAEEKRLDGFAPSDEVSEAPIEEAIQDTVE